MIVTTPPPPPAVVHVVQPRVPHRHWIPGGYKTRDGRVIIVIRVPGGVRL